MRTQAHTHQHAPTHPQQAFSKHHQHNQATQSLAPKCNTALATQHGVWCQRPPCGAAAVAWHGNVRLRASSRPPCGSCRSAPQPRGRGCPPAKSAHRVVSQINARHTTRRHARSTTHRGPAHTTPHASAASTPNAIQHAATHATITKSAHATGCVSSCQGHVECMMRTRQQHPQATTFTHTQRQ